MSYDLLETDGMGDGELAECRECGHRDHFLAGHLRDAHGMTLETYMDLYGGAVCSPALVREYHATKKGATRRPATNAARPTVTFAGIEFPLNVNVPAEACLKFPPKYAVPAHGALATDVESVAVAVRRGRSLWVSGPQGTGKDAVFHAISALTRTPTLPLQVIPDADIRAWLFSRSFDASGTRWEEGVLLKALRDGYRGRDGAVVPYLIVLSDIDRATRSQLEYLRMVLDSIEGRVMGPNGEIYRVLEGTRIVATANSTGAGDPTGRYVSVNPVDSSILDRFNRKVVFHHMDKRDEEPILRAKYPTLHARFPEAIGALMNASEKIRQAVVAETVYCEWSHRAACAVCEAAEDFIETLPRITALNAVMRRAIRTVLDGLPNKETQDAVEKIMDPHFPGGLIPTGRAPARGGDLR